MSWGRWGSAALHCAGTSFLAAESLCKDCVVERCRVLRLKNQLNEDHKTIANMVKVTVTR